MCSNLDIIFHECRHSYNTVCKNLCNLRKNYEILKNIINKECTSDENTEAATGGVL